MNFFDLTKTKHQTKASPAAAGVVFILVGIGLLGWALDDATYEVSLSYFGESTAADIISKSTWVESHKGGNSQAMFGVKYSFSINGTMYSKSSLFGIFQGQTVVVDKAFYDKALVGSNIQIRYAPFSPAINSPSWYTRQLWVALFVGTIGIALIVAGLQIMDFLGQIRPWIKLFMSRERPNI